MTITNTFLTEIAKAINKESFITPNYLAVGSSAAVTAIATTDTVLIGKFRESPALTGSRTTNQIQLSAIFSGVNVINTATQDTLVCSGICSNSTGSYLLEGVTHPGVTQTTNYDVEIIYNITVQ